MATKRKTKRFVEGGMSDEDVASFAGTPENESNAGMAAEAGMMEKEPEENFKSSPKAKAKAPVVTKEELAKSGLSLRDYMNKQQGLTRRGSAKSADDELASVASSRAEARKATEDKPKLKYQSLQDRAKSYEDERAKSGVGMYGTTKSAPKEERKVIPLKSTKAEKNSFMGSTGLKSGGSVSSASRRADGAASKGKTKGRMV
jgi:hypothetical protein